MTVARKLRNFLLTLRRLARTNTVRVPVLSFLLGTLPMAGLYFVRQPAPLPPSGVTMTMNGAGGHFFAVTADDLVAQFEQTRVGHVLFASSVSDHCRRLLFNNQTGGTYEAGQVFCGQVLLDKPVEVSGADRMRGVRKSFQK